MPLIPLKETSIFIGPGEVKGSIEIIDDDSPLESVKPVANTISSILILNGTEITGSPELSTIEMSIESDSPLVVLLSGSRSRGLRIDSEEYPLLSNKELFELSLK